MRVLTTAFLLLTLASCGKNSDDANTHVMKEKLTCSVPVMVNGIFTPKVTITPETIEAVEKEFQGRPFNRNAFWSVLTRETRTTLNLELNSQTKVPEEMLYKGVVLFFENYLLNPTENFHLRTSTFHVIYAEENADKNTVKSPCGPQDNALASIDISKVIFAKELEDKLSCEIGSSRVVLHIYKNHVIIWNRNERALFARAEIIRNDDESAIKLRAMDPDQRSLELNLSKKEKNVVLQFYGKTTMIGGSGTCRD